MVHRLLGIFEGCLEIPGSKRLTLSAFNRLCARERSALTKRMSASSVTFVPLSCLSMMKAAWSHSMDPAKSAKTASGKNVALVELLGVPNCDTD